MSDHHTRADDRGLHDVSIERFLWSQTFAARLAALGAPLPLPVLARLGELEFDGGERRDPLLAANCAWDHWPTAPGACHP
jgi:hypothetical protein